MDENARQRIELALGRKVLACEESSVDSIDELSDRDFEEIDAIHAKASPIYAAVFMVFKLRDRQLQLVKEYCANALPNGYSWRQWRAKFPPAPVAQTPERTSTDE